MLFFTMDYSKSSENGQKLKLVCRDSKVGDFDVFSGSEPYINIPECSYIPSKSAIPVGQYWIVDRPEGNWKNQVFSFGKDIYRKVAGGRYLSTPSSDTWFGLFDTTTMSDKRYIYNISRGSFRMHPLRANGTGTSEGCITFFSVDEFLRFRKILQKSGKTPALGAGKRLMIYGRVDVINGEPLYDYDNDGFQCLPLSGKIKKRYSSLDLDNSAPPMLTEEKFSPYNDIMLRESLCYQETKNSLLENKKSKEKQKKERELIYNQMRQSGSRVKY